MQAKFKSFMNNVIKLQRTTMKKKRERLGIKSELDDLMLDTFNKTLESEKTKKKGAKAKKSMTMKSKGVTND